MIAEGWKEENARVAHLPNYSFTKYKTASFLYKIYMVLESCVKLVSCDTNILAIAMHYSIDSRVIEIFVINGPSTFSSLSTFVPIPCKQRRDPRWKIVLVGTIQVLCIYSRLLETSAQAKV